ncbi:MAG: hypothetical protein ABI193_15245 [Minicystis sp.]
MGALTADRVISSFGTGRRASCYQLPVKGSTTIFKGATVGKNADGLAVPMNGTDNTLTAYGTARFAVDNSAGADGAKEITVDPGVYPMTGSGLGFVDVGKRAYATSDQDFSTSSSAGVRPYLGVIEFVDSATSARISIEPFSTDTASSDAALESTANGQGASKVGIEDAGSFTAEVDAEGAMQELYQNALSVQKTLPIPILSALEVATGALLIVFADGASSVPGTQVANSKAAAVRWNNHATPAAILQTIAMPQDLDDTAAVTFHALVSKSGATLADATKLTVGAFEQTVAALHDADTDFGGDTSAVVGDATAKTVTEVTLTLAAADVHAAPSAMTFTIKPKAGTLGTDDLFLHAAWLEYKPKLMTS